MNTWNISLQDSNSPSYEMMIFFHDFTMMNVIFILLMIAYMIYSLTMNTLTNRFLLQNHLMEIIWTISPMFILLFIAIPSLKTLYLSDEMPPVTLTIKTIGHQWYWSYEYSDNENLSFDSFMVPPNSMNKNNFRLLDVDNRCVIPYNTPTRILTTSMDVIHSWAIPSLGVKMDSVPGRLNQYYLTLNRPGLFIGQCSEICGMNHSFMPIVLESTNLKNFKNLTFPHTTPLASHPTHLSE
uniref:Cytochrome c oxidase subunit 2 n=1 Tax=Leptomyrmex pallens TaxID=611136 RepID=V5JEZ0_9HYME|nr:cytochrome c oxidase subunit II [Leptomyrmex pallens]AGL61393.1 cytochrome c oxidase subunit II [Leptomyrmex pallens]